MPEFDGMSDEENKDALAARELFQAIKEISELLDTNLDPVALRYCIRLCEKGINPETLALIVLEIQNQQRYHNAKQKFTSNGSETSGKS